MKTGTAAGFVTTGTDTAFVANEVDLAEVQRAFEQRLDDLLQQWFNITAKQRQEILDQVRLAVTSDDLAALATLHVSTTEAAQALTEAMSDMALEAARGMSKEAAKQGVRIDPVASDTSLFANIAAATAVLLAQGLTNSAGRQALRQWSVSTSGDDVVESVREHLESLSDAFVRDHLGGALTSAQNAGRLATALSGPTVSLYASEVMDRNTCPPCAAVDGKWLGNTDDPDTPARVAQVYPNGGYRFCEGGVRCRGTIISVYRPETVTALLNHPGHSSQKSHGRKGGVAGARSLEELNTLATAEARRITGRDIEFALAGSDLEIAKEHVSAVLEGLQRYPDAPLSYVGSYGPGGSKLPMAGKLDASNPDAYAVTAGSSAIYFNNRFATQPDAYRAALRTGELNGDLVSGSPRGVALHEFGHVVTEKAGGAGAAAIVARRMAVSKGQDVQHYVADRVSNYATESPHELAGEAYADVLSFGSDSSPLSRAIVDTVDILYAGGDPGL